MGNQRNAFLDVLHERVGTCGHCGKRRCPARKEWSTLPRTLKLDDVMAALDRALPEDGDEPAAPPATEGTND